MQTMQRTEHLVDKSGLTTWAELCETVKLLQSKGMSCFDNNRITLYIDKQQKQLRAGAINEL